MAESLMLLSPQRRRMYQTPETTRTRTSLERNLSPPHPPRKQHYRTVEAFEFELLPKRLFVPTTFQEEEEDDDDQHHSRYSLRPRYQAKEEATKFSFTPVCRKFWWHSLREGQALSSFFKKTNIMQQARPFFLYIFLGRKVWWCVSVCSMRDENGNKKYNLINALSKPINSSLTINPTTRIPITCSRRIGFCSCWILPIYVCFHSAMSKSIWMESSLLLNPATWANKSPLWYIA